MSIGGICFAPAGDACFTCSADKVIDAYVNDALAANSFKAVFILLYLAFSLLQLISEMKGLHLLIIVLTLLLLLLLLINFKFGMLKCFIPSY